MSATVRDGAMTRSGSRSSEARRGRNNEARWEREQRAGATPAAKAATLRRQLQFLSEGCTAEESVGATTSRGTERSADKRKRGDLKPKQRTSRRAGKGKGRSKGRRCRTNPGSDELDRSGVRGGRMRKIS